MFTYLREFLCKRTMVKYWLKTLQERERERGGGETKSIAADQTYIFRADRAGLDKTLMGENSDYKYL